MNHVAVIAWVGLALGSAGCGSSHAPDDGGGMLEPDADVPDARTDDRSLGPGMGSCVPGAFGGLECSGGPCPYDCCMDGVVETCFIAPGYECSFAAPTLCGGGTCAPPGEMCPPCDEDEWWADADGDGVGGSESTLACEMPPGYAPATGDCDDDDPTIGALADDAFEENDAIAGAPLLELARYDALAVCAVAPTMDGRDADYYELPAVDPAAQRYLRIDVEDGIGIEVTQYDASGAMVAYANGTGPDFLGTLVTPDAAYVGIERFASASVRCTCARYDLEVATHILW